MSEQKLKTSKPTENTKNNKAAAPALAVAEPIEAIGGSSSLDWPSCKKRPAIQAGLATVGPNKLTETIVPPCGRGVLKVRVTFPSPFRNVPFVTVTALDQPGLSATAQDTFSVSLASVSQTSFTAKVWRVDEPGGETGFSDELESLARTTWAQNLTLSWIAIAPRSENTQPAPQLTSNCCA